MLAIAYTDDPENLKDDLVFVGLVGMIDPSRTEVADALAATKRAGIDVKMITGDNVRTAAAIAGELGMGQEVTEGRDLDQLMRKYWLNGLRRSTCSPALLPNTKYASCGRSKRTATSSR